MLEPCQKGRGLTGIYRINPTGRTHEKAQRGPGEIVSDSAVAQAPIPLTPNILQSS